MGKFSNTWSLMSDSFRVLIQDKEMMLIQSTLQVIFQTALYYYARHRQAPAGFAADTLNNAVGFRE